MNAKQVQMWLGHHSPAFTLATYVHLLPADLPDAAFLDDLTGAKAGTTEPPESLATRSAGSHRAASLLATHLHSG